MKYPNIIGREVEISTLERLYKSKKSEFVAIYGRRRIGKSYLVNEVYFFDIFVPSSSCATSAGLLVCHRILAYQLVCFPDGLYVRCDSMITTFHSIDKGLCFVEIAL